MSAREAKNNKPANNWNTQKTTTEREKMGNNVKQCKIDETIVNKE